MLTPFMHFTIAQHSRWLLPLLVLLFLFFALVLGILLIQSEHELAESTKLNSNQLIGSAYNQRSPLASHYELSSPVKSGATRPDTTSPSLAGTHHEGDEGVVTEVAMEEAGPVTPDAPPFLYEINQAKFARLDTIEQISVQKAFEAYLALHQGGTSVPDINSLKADTERIKDQLASEIGSMAVHDLMQAE